MHVYLLLALARAQHVLAELLANVEVLSQILHLGLRATKRELCNLSVAESVVATQVDLIHQELGTVEQNRVRANTCRVRKAAGRREGAMGWCGTYLNLEPSSSSTRIAASLTISGLRQRCSSTSAFGLTIFIALVPIKV